MVEFGDDDGSTIMKGGDAEKASDFVRRESFANRGELALLDVVRSQGHSFVHSRSVFTTRSISHAA